MPPRLSVVMPTFNRLQWLGASMDSILAPGLDLELVVLDNGSTDGTWPFLQDRAQRDSRIRLVRWEVNSAGEAYPSLLELAEGEYVSFFADDDEMLPGGLERKMKVLDAHPEVGLVFSTVRCMDAAGKDLGLGGWTVIAEEDFTGRGDLFDSLILGNFIPMPAAMFRRALAPKGDILRDPTFIVSHDWQFWLDLTRRTRAAFLREPTANLRMHDGQVTVVDGVKLGKFAEVNLRVWRHWMIESNPPFIPSTVAWGAMTRSMLGHLTSAYGQDKAKIQDGLTRLAAIRREQDERLAALGDGQPELFLWQGRWESGTWMDFVSGFLKTFSPGDPVALALVIDAESGPTSLQASQSLDEFLAKTGQERRSALRILETKDLFEVCREFSLLQGVPPSAGRDFTLEGALGRRFAAAVTQNAGGVLS